MFPFSIGNQEDKIFFRHVQKNIEILKMWTSFTWNIMAVSKFMLHIMAQTWPKMKLDRLKSSCCPHENMVVMQTVMTMFGKKHFYLT